MTEIAQATICPGCGARGTENFLAFFSLKDVPVNSSALLRSAAAARECPRGRLDLTLCQECGLIFNRSFDASRLDYDEAYDNALDFSPTFQVYAEKLAERLRQRYQLRNKRIIEIGSGRGGFLELLAMHGENHCIGYDPAFDPAAARVGGSSAVRFVQDYYSERYAHEPVDFLVCRHVLEHMPEPLAFLSGLRRALGAQGEVSLYFEVPNALQLLNGPSLWDVIYQHVLYFTAESLRAVFGRAGFDLLDSGLAFLDQYLWVEARTASPSRKASSAGQASGLPVSQLARRFADRFRDTLDLWGEALRQWQAEGKRIVLWGAGTKGVTFLNTVDGAQAIGAVVDLNPRKQGMCVPGTGQRISAPVELTRKPAEVAIVLNPAYVREVGAMLEQLHVPAEMATFATVSRGRKPPRKMDRQRLVGEALHMGADMGDTESWRERGPLR